MTEPNAAPAGAVEVRAGRAGAPAGRRSGNWKDEWLPLCLAVVFSLAVWVGLLAAREAGLLFLVEARWQDLLVRLAPRLDAGDSPVLVVRIDENDIRRWNQYPMSDPAMADLLDRLLSMNPRSIGVDIYRDVITPDIRLWRERGAEAASEAFHRARLDELLRTRSAVFAAFYNASDVDFVGPPGELAGRFGRVGFTNLLNDSDGPVRRYLLSAQLVGGEQTASALGFLVARRWLFATDSVAHAAATRAAPATPATAATAVRRPRMEALDRLADVALALRSGAYVPRVLGDSVGGTQILMDWRGPRSFESYSVGEVMAEGFDASRVAGRAVLIGVNTKSVKDLAPTPLDAVTPGVEVHAHAADQLIAMALHAVEGPGAGRMGAWWWPEAGEQAWIALWTLVGGLIGWRARSAWVGAPLVAGASSAVLGASWWAAQTSGWIPAIPAVLGALMAGALVNALVTWVERRDRRAWETLSVKVLSPEIAGEVWRSRRDLIDHGRIVPKSMTATVLFCDLKGFSSFAQSVEPDVLIGWLNEFFDPMSRAVRECGGCVNKYAGDQIMAMFGPPLPRTTRAEHRQDAVNAIRCAILMRKSLSEINLRWASLSTRARAGDASAGPERPNVRMRVGINTGPLVAGSLGGSERLEYTVIGHTVNAASRLESVDKDRMDEQFAPGGCRILIGPGTADLVGDVFRLVPFGQTELAGMTGKVAVWAVVD